MVKIFRLKPINQKMSKGLLTRVLFSCAKVERDGQKLRKVVNTHGLSLKQKKFADEYIIRKRVWACNELAKRYCMGFDSVPEGLARECKGVIASEKTTAIQKLAAKSILQIKYGKIKANNIVESFAIVKDRRDSLVIRWVKKVKNRDIVCQLCGSTDNLSVHHISHWSDDPINRINVDNGILLCGKCHSLQHPEISIKMFKGVK